MALASAWVAAYSSSNASAFVCVKARSSAAWRTLNALLASPRKRVRAGGFISSRKARSVGARGQPPGQPCEPRPGPRL